MSSPSRGREPGSQGAVPAAPTGWRRRRAPWGAEHQRPGLTSKERVPGVGGPLHLSQGTPASQPRPGRSAAVSCRLGSDRVLLFAFQKLLSWGFSSHRAGSKARAWPQTCWSPGKGVRAERGEGGGELLQSEMRSVVAARPGVSRLGLVVNQPVASSSPADVRGLWGKGGWGNGMLSWELGLERGDGVRESESSRTRHLVK